MESRKWSENERKAVAGLVAEWNETVARGETTETEMAMGLEDQLAQATQGWSAGMETDADARPDLAALVGLAEDMDDEEWDAAWERWEAVEQEAARRWLEDHPKARARARAEREAEEAPTPETAELESKAWEVAQAAWELARQAEAAGLDGAAEARKAAEAAREAARALGLG